MTREALDMAQIKESITRIPLTREQWITKYGGQELLDREGFDVVPCVDCDDKICHGWRVELKGTK